MINAKKELLEVLEQIEKTIEDIEAYCILYTYKIGKSKEIKGENPDALLNFLNFEYDNGYGLRYLYGKILFKDNSWLERGEYDGSEWWEYKISPKKENLLKGNCYGM